MEEDRYEFREQDMRAYILDVNCGSFSVHRCLLTGALSVSGCVQ